MTSETTAPITAPQPPVISVTEVYRALGRLVEAQAQTKGQLARIEDRFSQQFVEVNRRIDRLFYAIIGIGGAIIAGLILQSVYGG